MAVLVTIPALVAIAVFVRLWGGLIVPRYQDMYHGWNPATPAYILAQIGLIAAFFAGYWLPGLLEILRTRRLALTGVFAAAAVLALVPATTYSFEAGRFSGLWEAVRRSQDLGLVIAAHTSPLILVGALAGAAAGFAWIMQATLRDRLILLTALAGFVTAQTASPQCWQRYHEPFLLMLAVLLASASPEPAHRGLRIARTVGPLAFAAWLAALSFAAMR